MKTKLIIEHKMDCGCLLRNTLYTTYDAPFDLSGRALRSWLLKAMASHKCPKVPSAKN